MSEVLEETVKSVTRMQKFETDELPREQDLGTSLNFREAVEPADKLVRLYKRLSQTAFDDLPDNLLNEIKQQADADYSKLEQILNFESTVPNPSNVRLQFINQINQAYDPAFAKLYKYISYGASVTVDFQRLETEARAVNQSIKDKADEVMESLAETKEQAESVLEEVRKVAAEQGVTQQAQYFKEESDSHSKQANWWLLATICLSIALGVYAVVSIFLHKLIIPETTAESIQLMASKILIFGVISYVLFLAAKNFLSHKHNAIINKHRQNALLTFNALVEAAKSEENKEIILAHASACIFAPQETGYSKGGGSGSFGSGKSIIELLPKSMIKVDGS
ncbi:MAG: hypothetical protein JRI85_17300 [Deltaproteobacteria bacterium]|nr:hypothetical protein [Deltaproteobacteria bacterium]